ncbi:MAG: YihY/virulence factor BrkB family protein, partial [Bacilli bacterium]
DIRETRNFFVSRFVSIMMTLAMMFMIAFALLVPVFGERISHFFHSIFGFDEGILLQLSITRWVLSFIILLIVFLFLFSFAPSKRMRLRDVYPGALFATLGWIISSYAFSFYVDNFGDYASKYGSISSIVVLLFWFFLTGFVIIIGGQMNAVIGELKIEAKNRQK